MNNIKIALYATVLSILISSLSCTRPGSHVIQHTAKVDVNPIAIDVGKATGFAFTAQKEVSDAQAQIIKAKIHLKETEALIADMKRNKSRYTQQIITLKDIFTSHVNKVEVHLIKTGKVLICQIAALKRAERELAVARERISTLEGERDSLRSANTKALSELEKAEKYKEKYHKLQKYKWIVWGLGAWIIVKFLGGLGAWSPQGRIAKALIG